MDTQTEVHLKNNTKIAMHKHIFKIRYLLYLSHSEESDNPFVTQISMRSEAHSISGLQQIKEEYIQPSLHQTRLYNFTLTPLLAVTC